MAVCYCVAMNVRKDNAGNLIMKPDNADIYVIVNRFQPLQAEESEQRYIRSRLGCVHLSATDLCPAHYRWQERLGLYGLPS